MTISGQDVLQTMMQWRSRIEAATWVVVRDTHAAEDIFQTVMLKALTKEVTFKEEKALLSWAFVTARREGIDWLRRYRKESIGLDSTVLELLQQEWLSESSSQGVDRLEALQDCIKNLPKKSSRLLRLRYFEGKGCAEVAEQIGVRLNTVYKRISRLHQDLKLCIEVRLNESNGS